MQGAGFKRRHDYLTMRLIVRVFDSPYSYQHILGQLWGVMLVRQLQHSTQGDFMIDKSIGKVGVELEFCGMLTILNGMLLS